MQRGRPHQRQHRRHAGRRCVPGGGPLPLWQCERAGGDGGFVGRSEAPEDVGAGGRLDAIGAEEVLDPERRALKRRAARARRAS